MSSGVANLGVHVNRRVVWKGEILDVRLYFSYKSILFKVSVLSIYVLIVSSTYI
ncbi:hypothetical protein NTGM5_120033 [Candidatus Nitrotoga sp. M5]|nr:hypothetical protein NTGM5_120033 [Candidatus Nitrotoga sp. M5]